MAGRRGRRARRRCRDRGIRRRAARPGTAFLDIDGERIPAIPAFDAPATDRDGIEGRLGPVGGDAEIAVAELPPQAVYSGEYERLRRGGAHRGFVILCAGDEPGAGACSMPSKFRAPFGMPTIHVSSAARDSVLAAAAERRPARLVSESRRTTSRRPQCRRLARRGTRPDRRAACRHDAAQLVVAIDRRARRRHRVLARNAAGAARRAPRSRRSSSPRIPATNSAISGSTTSSRGGRDGTGKRPRAARSGCITAPISAPPAGRCRWCRRMPNCANWRRPRWHAQASSMRWRRRIWCRAARRATSTAPAGAI